MTIERNHIIIFVVALLIGFGGGWWGNYTWTHSDWLTKLHDLQAKLTTEQNKPPIIKEVVKTQTQTQVAYVPKETVKYIDQRTGRELTSQEIESLNVNIKQPDFAFTVNGHPAKFEKTQEERWVFDKNKGLLSQTSTASIDIKVPTIDKTKHLGIGGIISNKGSAPLADYANASYSIGVFYVPDFYGATGTFRF